MDVANKFKYIKVNKNIQDLMNDLRRDFIILGEELEGLLTDSREKSLALTNLQQAMMWANTCLCLYEENE